MTPTGDRSTSDLLALLEQELTLLARHHLSSAQHDSDLELDRSGYQLLSRLRLGPLSLGQLAEAFRLDVSTVNRQVAALLRAGLVERLPDPGGSLARVVRPTRAGLGRLRHDRRVKQARVHQVIADWDEADVAHLQELLTRFNGSIETLEGRPWPRG